MTLRELLEKRGLMYEKTLERPVTDFQAGYTVGWKMAYRDLLNIIEYNNPAKLDNYDDDFFISE